MKILFVKKLYSPVGGSEALVSQWARRLTRMGHQVGVIALWPLRPRHNFPTEDRILRRGDRFRCIDDAGVAVYQLEPRLGRPGKLLDLLPFCALARPDVAAPLAAGYDLVHNVCREYSGLARGIAQRYGLPLVLTPLPHPGQPFSGASGRDAERYRHAQGIVAMTAHERCWYASLGVSPDRVAVVGSGAVINEGGDGEAFRKRHSISGPIVLFVGRKEPYKGYLAIKAAAPLVWRSFPDAHFVFIGETGMLARLREPLLDRRDPRLVNLRVVGEREKADAYAACDVFCMPSTHETLGLTYLEAWSYGKPVIGGNIAPLREVIRHGTDGLLVRQDVGEVASALIYFLADTVRAREMGQAGRRRLEAEFNWPSVMSKLEGFYRRLLA